MVKTDFSVLKVTKTVLMVFGFHCDADLDINLMQPKQNLGFLLLFLSAYLKRLKNACSRLFSSCSYQV